MVVPFRQSAQNAGVAGLSRMRKTVLSPLARAPTIGKFDVCFDTILINPMDPSDGAP